MVVLRPAQTIEALRAVHKIFEVHGQTKENSFIFLLELSCLLFFTQIFFHLPTKVRPALRTHLKMSIRLRFVQDLLALPAEVGAAVLACHLITAFRLLDRKVAGWAHSRAVANIE